MAIEQHTTSQLIPFQFDTYACPVRLDDHGVPWWGLLDVCGAIGLQNTTQAASRLRPHESTILSFSEDGRPHRLLLVNESGLYRLIMRSNKPEAERFQDWVCETVLPQIRKTGQYLPESRQLTTSEMFLAQATINVELEQRQFAIEARQDTQDEKIAALQERQPPEGRLNAIQFLKTYCKPRLPKEVLDAFKYHCRRIEQPVMFRPDGFDNAFPYYTLDALARAYEEATRQLTFLPGRRAEGGRL